MHIQLAAVLLLATASCAPDSVVPQGASAPPSITPAELASQRTKDEQTLRALRSSGSDLAKAHAIEHHFVCADRDASERFAVWARAVPGRVNGPHAQEYRGKEYFTCDVVRETVPTIETVTSHTIEMLEAASRLGVEYDGWGCSVVK